MCSSARAELLLGPFILTPGRPLGQVRNLGLLNSLWPITQILTYQTS
jgi:hypothetical protein